MEYPEDKVIISRSKLEAMEAELAAYKNNLVDYKSNEIIQQQQEEIERLKNYVNELGITLNESEKAKFLKVDEINMLEKKICTFQETLARNRHEASEDAKKIKTLEQTIEFKNMKIERMKKNRFRFWKKFE